MHKEAKNSFYSVIINKEFISCRKVDDMKKTNLIFILILSVLFSTSCNQPATGNRAIPQSQSGDVTGGVGGIGSGNGAVGGNQVIEDAETVEQAVIEIRHLIEPLIDENSGGGTYLKKLTIPKNYNGLLYIAGLNISTLVDFNIKVRFKFGVDSSIIDVPATVSTGAGLTPQTNVQVLILDLRSMPFKNVRLNYDLYDYNTYDFAGDGSQNPNEPVQVNRDKNLFCRGLSLEDDPTFLGSVSNGCADGDNICKFAYAKVVDQGLVSINGAIETPITPMELQSQSGSTTYYTDTDEIKLGRCLNDNPALYANTYKYSDSLTFSTSLFIDQVINGNTYQYKGPYRKVEEFGWQILGAARTSFFGLYSNEISVPTVSGIVTYPIGSKLFPLASQFDIREDSEYLGSSTPDGAKNIVFQAATGASLWMDGCNARATSSDFNGEHVGSCNVTSKIEIIKVNDDGTDDPTPVVSQDVKLQLVKESRINSSGDDVLLPSFQGCSSTSQCGSDECCINKRCWDQSLVSQCVEDEPSFGLQIPGSSCSSDLECASLCCSQSTGRCAVHDTLQEPPVYCAKQTGQKCIAKEWCAKVPVTRCFIVNTGIDNQGGDTCALRCYNFEEFGDCENGTCKPPEQPILPTFDPNDPNRCEQACDPPDFSDGVFDPDFECGT